MSALPALRSDAAPPLSFSIPGRPVPKARARKGGGRHFYTPEQTRTYEFKVALLARQARTGWENIHGRRWPLDAAYALHVDFFFNGREGDGSNCLKSIEDGAQRILWDNDRQVRRGMYEVHRVGFAVLERADLTVSILDPMQA